MDASSLQCHPSTLYMKLKSYARAQLHLVRKKIDIDTAPSKMTVQYRSCGPRLNTLAVTEDIDADNYLAKGVVSIAHLLQEIK